MEYLYVMIERYYISYMHIIAAATVGMRHFSMSNVPIAHAI